MVVLMHLPKASSRTVVQITAFCVFATLLYYIHHLYSQPPLTLAEPVDPAWQRKAASITNHAREYTEAPIESPYKDKFRELGERTKVAREWIKFLDSAPPIADKRQTLEAVEAAMMTLYPYLSNSPRNPSSKTPFADLRATFVPRSRGIVLPTGKKTLRFAAHLIGSLTEVLHTKLPIQVIYAGDNDLPPEDRARLKSRFARVEFMDVLTAVDDAKTGLVSGGWAIKAFAALYSPFEEVIVLDADCVFVQRPEALLQDPEYRLAGAMLFHDRLLWQHAFRERHDWWKDQIREPSAQLNNSLVWSEDYAEEGDSGVVIIDKSRLDVLMGLLHVAWQNTEKVRDEVTYKITYGDKESWWFGLELCGSPYVFEKHYATMVGWIKDRMDNLAVRICSFVIGHVDHRDELSWYNGGLLKNKIIDPHEYGLPDELLLDGTWEKGASKEDMSCMVGNYSKPIMPQARQALEDSITLAKKLDKELGFV